MTRKELAEMLGYKSTDNLQPAVSKAKKLMPSIAGKINYNGYSDTSFTLEEILCICSCVIPAMNELQLELVKENYIQHDKTYISRVSKWIDGNEKFAERAAKNRKVMACANCAYCCGKSRKGTNSSLSPYCKFYDKFIVNIKVGVKHRDWNGRVTEKMRAADLFKDRCPSWVRSEVHFFNKK